VRVERTAAGCLAAENDAGTAGLWASPDGRTLRWGDRLGGELLLSELTDASGGPLLMTDVLPNPLTPTAAAELVRDGVRLPRGGSRSRDEQLAKQTERELYGGANADPAHRGAVEDAQRRLRRPGHDAETATQIEETRSRLAHPPAGRPVRRDDEPDAGSRPARTATADMGGAAREAHELLFGGRRMGEPAERPEQEPRPRRGAGRSPGGPPSPVPGMPPSLRRPR
jgi:hypothetical protein